MRVRLLAVLAVVLICDASPGQEAREDSPQPAPAEARQPTQRLATARGFWTPPASMPSATPRLGPPRLAALPGETRSPGAEPPSEADVQPAGTMTLADLESIALGNNPTVQQASMRVRALEHKYLQVGLYPNPVVGYSGEEMGDDGTAGKQGAFFGQEVVTAGKLRLRRAAVSQEVAQACAALAAQRQRVLNDVRTGYYEAMLAQKAVQLDESLVTIGDAAVKSTEDLLAAQEVSRVAVLQAQVEAESARLRLEDARNRQRAVWQRLAAVLGVPDMDPPRLSGDLESDLPEFTWSDALTQLLAESPQLKEARAGVARARWIVERERAEAMPNVDVRASVHRDNSGRQTIAGVEVGFPLPLFDRNQGNISRARSELVVATAEVRRLELALRRRLAAAFEHYDNAQQQVRRYRTSILPNAQKSLELVRLGYRQGEFGYLTMLTAQRTYFRANLDYLDSLRELWTSSVQIEGLLLEGGLQAQQSEPLGKES